MNCRYELQMPLWRVDALDGPAFIPAHSPTGMGGGRPVQCAAASPAVAFAGGPAAAGEAAAAVVSKWRPSGWVGSRVHLPMPTAAFGREWGGIGALYLHIHPATPSIGNYCVAETAVSNFAASQPAPRFLVKERAR